MNQHSKVTRILSIAPSSRGFGFAVIEDQKLIHFGTKAVAGNKNKESLTRVEELIREYEPSLMACEDAEAKGSRRHPRIQTLIREIAALASGHKVKLILLPRDRLLRTFFEDGKGTKQEIAALMAEWYPEELADRLPRKRKAWESEKRSMDVFDAVALGVAVSLKK